MTTISNSLLGKLPSTTLLSLSALHHSFHHPTTSMAHPGTVGRYLLRTLSPLNFTCSIYLYTSALASCRSPPTSAAPSTALGLAGVLAGVLGGTRTKCSTDRNSSGRWVAPASAVNSTACESFESDAKESRTVLSGDWRAVDLNICFWIRGVRGVSGPLL